MSMLKEKVNWYNDKTEESRVLAWWSGGVASAIACKIALETYKNVFVAFCDTGWEHPDTFRFMKDFERALGIKVNIFKSDVFDSPVDVWERYLGLNFAFGAPCSTSLKREVRVKKVQRLDDDYCQIFGFDFGSKEINRANGMSQNNPELNPKYPLIENKITREALFREVSKLGIEPPVTYKHFLNNNCIGADDSELGGCVQGGIGYWQKMREIYPKKFNHMANKEHEITELKIQSLMYKSENDENFKFDHVTLDIWHKKMKKGVEVIEEYKFKPVTICKDQRVATNGDRLFLAHNPAMLHIKTIDEIEGKQPVSHFECNGFCSTNDTGQEVTMFQQELF